MPMRDLFESLGVTLILLGVLATIGYGIWTFFHPTPLNGAITATALVITVVAAFRLTRDGGDS